MDRLGRKFSMLVMFLLGFILLLPLVIHQNEIFTTLLLFGARMFISATFIVACIYAPEVILSFTTRLESLLIWSIAFLIFRRNNITNNCKLKTKVHCVFLNLD